jgi:hypothetical protein
VAEAARVKEKLYESAKRTLPKLERLTVETDPSLSRGPGHSSSVP